MKRFGLVALLIAGLALPACAQHGVSHGGFSGRSVGAFHSGFSARHYQFSAPQISSSFTGTRRFAVLSRTFAVRSRAFAGTPRNFARLPMRSFAAHRSSVASGLRYRHGSGFHSEYHRYRHRRRSFYGFGAPVFYSEWIGPGPYGYLLNEPEYYASAYNATWADEEAGEGGDGGYNSQAYEPQTPEPEPPVYREDYYATSRPHPVSGTEAATTILFKDGRAPEHIYDYAMTRTTLYILGEHPAEIPLAQIDVAATETANRAAGIDFQVPGPVPQIAQ